MATRRQPLIPIWLLPGLLNAILLVGVLLLIFGVLLSNITNNDWRNLLHDNYIHHVIAFSFWQALLSACLSVALAIPLSRALWQRRFPGRQILIRLCAMTLILPALVAVFGLLSVYGHEGWLAQICAMLNIEYKFSLYGLHGILLAHVFFNLPLATRLLLQALENIPSEQNQLSAQLGIEGWYFFRLVIWPWLQRQIFPVASLIFMLCFTSFSTVLVLGGGPQATTIELAIFQALSYDYDPGRAATLALLQTVCCLSLVALSQRLSKVMPGSVIQLNSWHVTNHGLGSLISDILIIIFALLLLLPPLLAIIVDGIRHGAYSLLKQSALWQSTWISLRVAISSGLLSVLLTMLLLWSSRELRLRQYLLAGQILEMSGMLTLAIPNIVLATGLFLLLNSTLGVPQQADSIVIVTNALMAIPYAMKVLKNPMIDISERYQRLCLSLDICGWQRIRLIELKVLQRPLAQALAFSCVLSVGDFGIVALFGNKDFCTLPFYFYQQIAAYHNDDSAVTALLLLLLCFLMFTFIEKIPGYYANSD